MRFVFANPFLLLFLLVVPTAAGQSKSIDFNRDIRPLLSKNCFSCHGPDAGHRKADLRLDLHDNVISKRDGYQVVVPGDPEESELFLRVISEDSSELMPPKKSGKALSKEQIELLKRWISEGAPYAEHWSFVKPTDTPPNPTLNKTWARSHLDRYVLAKLETRKLQPAPEADRYTLIRRLYLDVIGLPPSPEEVRQFVDDKSPTAYSDLIDKLLALPTYGEHWARVWLDLARYADSTGFGSDPPRTIWRYRDWVIEALNANMPFDQFSVEQLAGDLLPKPSTNQRLATAFHRNTMTNTEGGTDDEEFRIAAVKDRAETTMQVWMGLTLRCANCHDHKFDPLPQADYYRMFAFFNQTADSDKIGDAPRIETPTREQTKKINRLRSELTELESELMSPTTAVEEAQQEWEKNASGKSQWRSVRFDSLATQSKAKLRTLDDDSVLATGPVPLTDTYVAWAEKSPGPIRGIRLELLPHPSLASGGLSRARRNSNIVLNHLELTVDFSQVKKMPGRYVRIDLPGKDKILSLAEVQVFSNGENIALTGQSRQSSTDYGGPSHLAIDGQTDGRFTSQSVTHTATEKNPWWELDLGNDQKIDRVALWNRTDGGHDQRLNGCTLTIRDSHGVLIWGKTIADAPKEDAAFMASGGQVTIPLHAPHASHSQAGFSVGFAIDSDRSAKSGWALAPNHGATQTAMFSTSFPVQLPQGARIGLTLNQSYGKQHVIGRFRLSVTPDEGPHSVIPFDINKILGINEEQRTEPDKASLARYYRSIAPALAELRAKVVSKKAEITASQPVTTPVMVELPVAAQRKSFLHVKGNFLSKGQEVKATTPAAFHPMPENAPRNRLGLARWLMSVDNPLTARVAVNRIWSRLFGAGLVETQEDFGSQGSLPTHQHLLDWLALEYQRSAWNTKAILKTILVSATYRQSSRSTSKKLAVDPQNRLFSRGARFRLDAEVLRDQALALSGLLSQKMYGPSVYPHQPSGLWQAAFDGQRKWPTSHGEDRYRRGIYTFLRRTIPYPSLATFDLPSRETCTPRRIPTNTPMQAFVTLNDPAWIEAARGLALRLMATKAEDATGRLAHGIFLCTQRPATSAQLKSLKRLLDTERAYFEAHRDEAKTLAGVPIANRPEFLNAHELASWIVVANVLLNLDTLFMKG